MIASHEMKDAPRKKQKWNRVQQYPCPAETAKDMNMPAVPENHGPV